MPKILCQTIITEESETEKTINFHIEKGGRISVGYSGFIDETHQDDTDNRLCRLIQEVVRNLFHNDNRFIGYTISKKDVEAIKKFFVTLNGRQLVHQFSVLRNSDDTYYAIYKVAY